VFLRGTDLITPMSKDVGGPGPALVSEVAVDAARVRHSGVIQANDDLRSALDQVDRAATEGLEDAGIRPQNMEVADPCADRYQAIDPNGPCYIPVSVVPDSDSTPPIILSEPKGFATYWPYLAAGAGLLFGLLLSAPKRGAERG